MGSVKHRADGMWRARYRGPDKKERSKHFTRKVDAEQWLITVEGSKMRGEWVDPALSRVTVGDWSLKWLDAQVALKPTTRARYEGIVRKHIVPTWGRVALAEVAPSDVAAWVGRLMASGLAAASVRYVHRVLALALEFAVFDGRLSRNPAKGVKLPTVRERPKVFLTHAQAARLADEIGGGYGTLVRFLAYTGLRWGEVAALRVEDIDLLRRRVHVERAMAEVGGRAVLGTPKDHERREVPFPAFLVDELAPAMAGRDGAALAFSAPGGGFLRNGNFRRNFFDAAAAAADVVGLTPHGLRHTAASLAHQAGASVITISRMLGHSTPQVTMKVYSHWYEEDLDAIAERLHTAKINSDADRVRTSTRGKILPGDFSGGQNAV